MTRNVLPDYFTFYNTTRRIGEGGKRYGKGRNVPLDAQGVGVKCLRVQARADVNEQLIVQSVGEVDSWLPPFLSDGSENMKVESPLCSYWPGSSAELIRQSVKLAC